MRRKNIELGYFGESEFSETIFSELVIDDDFEAVLKGSIGYMEMGHKVKIESVSLDRDVVSPRLTVTDDNGKDRRWALSFFRVCNDGKIALGVRLLDSEEWGEGVLLEPISPLRVGDLIEMKEKK